MDCFEDLPAAEDHETGLHTLGLRRGAQPLRRLSHWAPRDDRSVSEWMSG